MTTQDELQQIRNIVREENQETEKRLKDFVKEEVGQSEKRLMSAITEQGHLLLDAIEINAQANDQEQRKLEKRVERIEKHLSLPPVK